MGVPLCVTSTGVQMRVLSHLGNKEMIKRLTFHHFFGLFFPSFFFTFSRSHIHPTPLFAEHHHSFLFSAPTSLSLRLITPFHIPDHTYTHHDYHKQGQADHLRHHPQRWRTGKHIEAPTPYYRPWRTSPLNSPFYFTLFTSNPPHQTNPHHHHPHPFFLSNSLQELLLQ